MPGNFNLPDPTGLTEILSILQDLSPVEEHRALSPSLPLLEADHFPLWGENYPI
jgi:hypothetical protein